MSLRERTDLDRCLCLHWQYQHKAAPDGCMFCHCDEYRRLGDRLYGVKYVVGDATQPIGEGNKVIAHICNDVGAWGRGFVMALSARWSEPEAAYRRWYRDGNEDGRRMSLGDVQFVEVEKDIVVANIIGQAGIRGHGALPPIRYEAIQKGLSTIAGEARARARGGAYAGFSVHMPRIGCGLAGGRWEQIEPLVRGELSLWGIDVTVYDLPSEDGGRNAAQG